MTVNIQEEPKFPDEPPPTTGKRKRRKRKQSEDGDDTDSCLWGAMDGCFWVDFAFGNDGCLPFGGDDGGCIDIDLGCFSFDGCSFDGCSAYSIVGLPLRMLVILGLILYGDWDFKAGRAKDMHFS